MEKDIFRLIPDEYKTKAISLSPIGLAEYGWRKEDIVVLINLLYCEDMIVLGGDVYEYYNTKIVPTQDNWSCDREEDESLDEFLKKSLEKTIYYIKSFDDESAKHLIFVPVVAEKSYFYLMKPNI